MTVPVSDIFFLEVNTHFSWKVPTDDSFRDKVAMKT